MTDATAKPGPCDLPQCDACRSGEAGAQADCLLRQAAAAAPPQDAGSGRWNAFVEAGPSRSVRVARLAVCPPALREEVRRHVETAFAIRQRKSALQPANNRHA